MKPKTLAEKQQIRYRMVYAALSTIIAIPVMAMGLLYVGVDPTSATGLFSISSATLGSIVITHFATTPKNDGGSNAR